MRQWIDLFEMPQSYRVEQYFAPVTGYGPYFRVVGPDGKEVSREIDGVTYPANGFQTARSATTFANKLNLKMAEKQALAEEALEVEEQGYGLRTYQNDEIALGGGIRSGSSPPGYTRLLYVVYDVAAFAAGTPQDDCEVGKVEVWGRDGTQQIDGLVNIEILKKNRRGGWGAKIIKALCDTCPRHFAISDIKPSAVSFWASLGCVFFNGTKQVSASEARKLRTNGVIPKAGCSDPLEDYSKINRGRA